ncbi:MAG: peptide deformylase [Acholeplasmatales bacterium]|nr:peptide deformylase [Methanobrevibacter sp.]MBP5445492.1 peptide deformylase [Acholeplasmatales bacterium]
MREIISALKHTIELNNIVSLSAPAIGYDKRIFCIKFDTEIKTFINPVIIQSKGI